MARVTIEPDNHEPFTIEFRPEDGVLECEENRKQINTDETSFEPWSMDDEPAFEVIEWALHLRRKAM